MVVPSSFGACFGDKLIKAKEAKPMVQRTVANQTAGISHNGFSGTNTTGTTDRELALSISPRSTHGAKSIFSDITPMASNVRRANDRFPISNHNLNENKNVMASGETFSNNRDKFRERVERNYLHHQYAGAQESRDETSIRTNENHSSISNNNTEITSLRSLDVCPVCSEPLVYVDVGEHPRPTQAPSNVILCKSTSASHQGQASFHSNGTYTFPLSYSDDSIHRDTFPANQTGVAREYATTRDTGDVMGVPVASSYGCSFLNPLECLIDSSWKNRSNKINSERKYGNVLGFDKSSEIPNHTTNKLVGIRKEIPPYCNTCKAYIVYESSNEQKQGEMLSNLASWLGKSFSQDTQNVAGSIDNTDNNSIIDRIPKRPTFGRVLVVSDDKGRIKNTDCAPSNLANTQQSHQQQQDEHQLWQTNQVDTTIGQNRIDSYHLSTMHRESSSLGEDVKHSPPEQLANEQEDANQVDTNIGQNRIDSYHHLTMNHESSSLREDVKHSPPEQLASEQENANQVTTEAMENVQQAQIEKRKEGQHFFEALDGIFSEKYSSDTSHRGYPLQDSAAEKMNGNETEIENKTLLLEGGRKGTPILEKDLETIGDIHCQAIKNPMHRQAKQQEELEETTDKLSNSSTKSNLSGVLHGEGIDEPDIIRCSTSEEKQTLVADYDEKRNIATKVIGRLLMEGYFLTQDQCRVCDMPLMEKAGFSECVVCPVVARKAKKRASEKRQALREDQENSNTLATNTNDRGEGACPESTNISPNKLKSPNSAHQLDTSPPQTTAKEANGNFSYNHRVQPPSDVHQGKVVSSFDTASYAAFQKEASIIAGNCSGTVPIFGPPKHGEMPFERFRRIAPSDSILSRNSALHEGKLSFDVSKSPSSITGDNLGSLVSDNEHNHPFLTVLRDGITPSSNAVFSPISFKCSSPKGHSEASFQDTDVTAVSQEVYNRLLNGWLLTNTQCPKCCAPLMQSHGNKVECISCNSVTEDRRKLDPPPSSVISGNYSDTYESNCTPSTHGVQPWPHKDDVTANTTQNINERTGFTYLAIPDDLDYNDEEAVLKFFAGVKNRKLRGAGKNPIEEEPKNAIGETKVKDNRDESAKQEEPILSVREKWNENVIVHKSSRGDKSVHSGDSKSKTNDGDFPHHMLGGLTPDLPMTQKANTADIRNIASRQKEILKTVLSEGEHLLWRQEKSESKKNPVASQSEGICDAMSSLGRGIVKREKLNKKIHPSFLRKPDPPQEVLNETESLMSDPISIGSYSSSLHTPMQLIQNWSIDEKMSSEQQLKSIGGIAFDSQTRDKLIKNKLLLTGEHSQRKFRNEMFHHQPRIISKEAPRQSRLNVGKCSKDSNHNPVYCRACGSKLKMLCINTFSEKWCANRTCSYFMIPDNDMDILTLEDYDSTTADTTVSPLGEEDTNDLHLLHLEAQLAETLRPKPTSLKKDEPLFSEIKLEIGSQKSLNSNDWE